MLIIRITIILPNDHIVTTATITVHKLLTMRIIIIIILKLLLLLICHHHNHNNLNNGDLFEKPLHYKKRSRDHEDLPDEV